MTTLGDREDGHRRDAPQDRPEGAHALLAALVDQRPLGLGGGAVDLALVGVGCRRPHVTSAAGRGRPPRPGSPGVGPDVRLGVADAAPPPRRPAGRPAAEPGRRRAVAQLRQEGLGRPLGQPVDHPVDEHWMRSASTHDEDDPQQQVHRPGEELASAWRPRLVVRQVPDQLAGQPGIGPAAGQQRRRVGSTPSAVTSHRPSRRRLPRPDQELCNPSEATGAARRCAGKNAAVWPARRLAHRGECAYTPRESTMSHATAPDPGRTPAEPAPWHLPDRGRRRTPTSST